MVDVQMFGPRAVYDAASAGYATAAEELWPWAADHLVELAAPAKDARVVDAACGPGTVTTRLSKRIGRSGSVLALDISPEMVALARSRVQLPQAMVHVGDMHELAKWGGGYDVVTCGLGLFFARDVAAVAADLWAAVRPGGRLAVSTVGAQFFSPMYEAFVRALLAEKPAADVVVPWVRTERIEQLEQLLIEGGVVDPQVTSEARRVPAVDIEGWWRIVESTGIRKLAGLVDAEQRARVRQACADHMADGGIDRVTFEVIFAVATKPE